jgi:glucosamine--fructose-6-phosphate aminotransferase (isomerizing)
MRRFSKPSRRNFTGVGGSNPSLSAAVAAANAVTIAREDDGAARRSSRSVLLVPGAPEMLGPFVCSVPLQLLAYRVVKDRGLDVDKPRNLAKSVTVE